MIFIEEVCRWFKNSEPHCRVQLICGLLNMCLPLELKFFRTVVAKLSLSSDGKNESDEKLYDIKSLGGILDEKTRSKLIVYIALLDGNNYSYSNQIFECISSCLKNSKNDEYLSNLSNSDKIIYEKQMLLVYTMLLYHPAFRLEEKSLATDKLISLRGAQLTSIATINNSCPPNESQQHMEACDSGLSIGTEPEGELLSDHSCVPNQQTDQHYQQIIPNQPFCPPGYGITELCGEYKKEPIWPVGPPPVPGISKGLIEPVSFITSPEIHIPLQAPVKSDSAESLLNEPPSMPTTYIYNSSIYEKRNIGELADNEPPVNEINRKSDLPKTWNGQTPILSRAPSPKISPITTNAPSCPSVANTVVYRTTRPPPRQSSSSSNSSHPSSPAMNNVIRKMNGVCKKADKAKTCSGPISKHYASTSSPALSSLAPSVPNMPLYTSAPPPSQGPPLHIVTPNAMCVTSIAQLNVSMGQPHYSSVTHTSQPSSVFTNTPSTQSTPLFTTLPLSSQAAVSFCSVPPPNIPPFDTQPPVQIYSSVAMQPSMQFCNAASIPFKDEELCNMISGPFSENFMPMWDTSENLIANKPSDARSSPKSVSTSNTTTITTVASSSQSSNSLALTNINKSPPLTTSSMKQKNDKKEPCKTEYVCFKNQAVSSENKLVNIGPSSVVSKGPTVYPPPNYRNSNKPPSNRRRNGKVESTRQPSVDNSTSSSQHSSPAQTPCPDTKIENGDPEIHDVGEQVTFAAQPTYGENNSPPPIAPPLSSYYLPNQRSRYVSLPHQSYGVVSYPPQSLYRYSVPPNMMIRPPGDKSSRDSTPPADKSESCITPPNRKSASPPTGEVPLMPSAPLPYNTHNYPMFPVGHPFLTPIHQGFMGHVGNGFVPSAMPHGFSLPPISSELLYASHYAMMNHQGHNGYGQLGPHRAKKPLTCYSCGQMGHRESECKESPIIEPAKGT